MRIHIIVLVAPPPGLGVTVRVWIDHVLQDMGEIHPHRLGEVWDWACAQDPDFSSQFIYL